MTRQRLVETPRTVRRRGSTTALVPVAPGRCPICDQQLIAAETTAQLPLLRHGGYGEVREHHRDHCPCGWTLDRGYSSTNPRSGS